MRVALLAVALSSCARRAVDAPPPAAQPGPLDLPYAEVVRRVGPHRLQMHWAHTLVSGDGTREALAQDVTLDVDDRGGFHLVDDNDQGQGREAIFAGGVLYTRHRYGRFLARDDGDAAAPALRDESWTTLRATLEIVGHGVDVVPRAGGLALQLASAPRAAPRETSADRRWRSTVKVLSVEGTAGVEGGVPVSVDLRTRYTFRKEQDTVTADVEYRHRITRGAQAEIAPAPDAGPTPSRRSLEDERKKLLEDAK